MRIFVAAWPSPQVVDAIAGLARPEHPSLRWTGPERWHVTLRFMGEVDDAMVPVLTDAVRAAASRLAPLRATLGPATVLLGRGVLILPVDGLSDLAAAVVGATRRFGRPPDDRPFVGHLTVARGRARRPIPVAFAGQPLGASWSVRRLTLVRSQPGAGGHRYDAVSSAPLSGGSDPGPKPDGQ